MPRISAGRTIGRGRCRALPACTCRGQFSEIASLKVFAILCGDCGTEDPLLRKKTGPGPAI